MPDPNATTDAGALDLARPPQHIVLLSDGTGNSRAKAQQTNVWRVYEALDLKDPATPQTPRQFALYDDGVGSSSFKPTAILGGALGFGLARNVRDLYAFLCRTWRPGDRIYAFGFSRGAFTIRVLVGLIASQGIVKYEGNEAELHRLVKAAYRAYRRRYRLPYFHYVGVLRGLRDAMVDTLARLRGKRTYDDVATGKRIAAELEGGEGHDQKTSARNQPARVDFLGLWDTVDAYGVPVDELGTFVNSFIWPFRMPDATLSGIVDRAVHALALDDERNTFHPKLWNHEAAAAGQPERISQVWFAGMHSDVGGGYADKGLAHVSLKWVIDQARACGLRFNAETLNRQEALSDENGPMNDSRRGIAGYYRYSPRRLAMLLEPHGLPRPTVHESVLRRIRVGQDAYAPIVLPPDFEVLPLAGGPAVPADDALNWSQQQSRAYADGVDRVFNRVWLRRCIYFATVASTLVLIALPLFSSAQQACTSAWCGAATLIRVIDLVLPASAASWTQWYATHPGTFALLALLSGAGLVAGGIVQRTIFDAMRRAWYAVPATRPSTLSADKPDAVPGPGAVERAVFRLRNARWYRAMFRMTRCCLLPALFGLALVATVLVLVNGFVFAVDASGGRVCRSSAAPVPRVGSALHAISLDTRALCASTGWQVERGGTYELLLQLPLREGKPEHWRDDTIPADLRGIAPQDTPLTHRLATLMKREISQPWLQPMLRVGSKGADVQPLHPDPSEPLNKELTTLRTRFVARSSGELFLYVNDAVGPPGARSLFQCNNHGTAQGTIRLVSDAPGAADSSLAPVSGALLTSPVGPAPADCP